jgi:aminoglycoside 3-N-acetyltransferase
VVRSAHPQDSFAAWGARSAWITDGHALDFGLGDRSPLARLYDLDGWVLLLGVGHLNNTSLHLAEHRASFPGRRVIEGGLPMVADGVRRWTRYRDLDIDESDFEAIGEAFERETGLVQRGRVGNGKAALMPQRPLVDFAVKWMEANR